MDTNYERRIEQRNREMQRRIAEQQRTIQKRIAEHDRQLASRLREQERLYALRAREMDRRIADQQRTIQRRIAEQERHQAERMREFSRQQALREKELRKRLAGKGYSEKSADNLFSSLGDSMLNDLFSRNDSTDAPVKPVIEQVISPSEAIRRKLMNSLPREKQQTLDTFEPALVVTVIATVVRAREVDPERNDWNIHLAYRRAVEIEQPDPLMLQKTQISGLLLDGSRNEAHYPF